MRLQPVRPMEARVEARQNVRVVVPGGLWLRQGVERKVLASWRRVAWNGELTQSQVAIRRVSGAHDPDPDLAIEGQFSNLRAERNTEVSRKGALVLRVQPAGRGS